ncbi:MAG: hypothetical protein OXC19_07445 [Bryobacterales bacterium]|nr:hypothetical protein [Bryobacterales bacterium]
MQTSTEFAGNPQVGQHVAAKQTGQYLLARERFPHTRDAPLPVHGPHCSLPYSGRGIDCGFQRLFRDAGIRGVGRRPARLHDLRHHSA